jgi:hypothetical protein
MIQRGDLVCDDPPFIFVGAMQVLDPFMQPKEFVPPGLNRQPWRDLWGEFPPDFYSLMTEECDPVILGWDDEKGLHLRVSLYCSSHQ